MKKTLITLLSVATLCAPLFVSANDDTAGKRDRKPPREGRPARAADSEDKGARGKRGERPDFASMTAEERLATLKKRMKANPKMAEMVTKRFDKDESGSLSDTELATAAEAMGKRGEKALRGKGKGKGKGRGRAEGEGKGKGLRGKRQDK